jgi:hypothetical protein
MIKIADGLIKDIKGYNIHLWASSGSSIEKSYDGCIVSPVIVAGGLPNLVKLSSAFRVFQYSVLLPSFPTESTK